MRAEDSKTLKAGFVWGMERNVFFVCAAALTKIVRTEII